MIKGSWSRSRLRQQRLRRLLFWRSGTLWLGCALLRMLSTYRPSSSGERQAQLYQGRICCLLNSGHAFVAGPPGFPAVCQWSACSEHLRPEQVLPLPLS